MKRTVQITQIALFAALTAVFSQISFPVPMTPIVFTMGVMAVYLTAALLPKWQAFLALIVYLLLGAIGLPVYSGFHGGIGTLLGPTGGYLMAYPIMAFLGAWLRELLGKTPLPRFVSCLIFSRLFFNSSSSFSESSISALTPELPVFAFLYLS